MFASDPNLFPLDDDPLHGMRARRRNKARLTKEQKKQRNVYRKILRKAGHSPEHVKRLPNLQVPLTNADKIGFRATALLEDLEFLHPYDKFAKRRKGPTIGGKVTDDDKQKFKHLMPHRLRPATPDASTKPRDTVICSVREVNAAHVTPDPDPRSESLVDVQVGPPGSKSDAHLPPKPQSEGAAVYFNYTGEWKRGSMQGHGTLDFALGGYYTGRWKGSLQDGEGEAEYLNGSVYQGSWKEGRMHGYGTLTHVGGYTYEGNFANGFRHGQGTATYPNGVKYTGNFEYGMRNGRGEMTDRHGHRYMGSWADDLIFGKGNLTLLDGRRYNRIWPGVTFLEAIRMLKAELLDEVSMSSTWYGGLVLTTCLADPLCDGSVRVTQATKHQRRLQQLLRIEHEEKLLDVVSAAEEKLAEERAIEEKKRLDEQRKGFLASKERQEELKREYIEKLMQEYGIDEEPDVDN